jgi:hypothetical protein
MGVNAKNKKEARLKTLTPFKSFCPGVGGNGQALGERRKEMREVIAICCCQYKGY